MMSEAYGKRVPKISIVLPTYNRARFLDDAFESIRQQQQEDWRLIVVDDGSTDDTGAVVARWSALLEQPVTYLHQANRGAYAARNAGVEIADSEYIAFFDSDDLWMPDFLSRTSAALDSLPDLDWVYAACRRVRASGDVVDESTFFESGRPRRFLAAPSTTIADVHLLAPADALLAHLQHGLFCGLQNSLIRRRVFAGDRFWEEYRVVEDVLFVTRALARGTRLGYIKDVLVTYRIHDGNSSASADGLEALALQRICEETVTGLERLRAEVSLSAEASRELKQALATSYFWRLGYACLWATSQTGPALGAMKSGLKLSPFDLRMMKTYAACLLRSRFKS